MNNIYSIGYGSRDINSFVLLLKKHEISTLVDIRSMPASRLKPDYNKKRFAQKLLLEGIEYIFLGDALGGKPKNQDLYTNGIVDYDKVELDSQYKSGILELIKQATMRTVCIMCAELKPIDCHRMNLVGETLHKQGVTVLHINERGEVDPHPENKNRLF